MTLASADWLDEPWGIALLALAGLVLVGLALWAHVRISVRLWSQSLEYESVELLCAPDGGVCELRRLRSPSADGAETAAVPPVLLVHGICANHRNLDLDSETSLARFLGERRRDVWLLTLRSGRPWRLREALMPKGFAVMVQHDLPLCVERVLEATGAPSLDYVGFSMGGMLLYAALGRSVSAAALRRVVTVGSPGTVGPPRGVPRLLRFVPRALVPRILTGTLGTMAAFAAEWFATPAHRILVNPANVARGKTRLALVDCVQDVSGPLLADFLRWSTTDGRVRVAGRDVLDGLVSIAVPALFVAGACDQVGPPRAVRAAFEAWGREVDGLEKQWLVLGEASGARHDYGHGDLAVGSRLGEELFPAIADFLAGPRDAA